MTFELYKDAAGYWRWRLKANNARTIADSAESYYNKSDCISAINLVQGSGSARIIER